MTNRLLQQMLLPFGLLGLLMLTACAHTPPSDPWDPIEPVNRVVYKFNRTADRYVLAPVARGYNRITPEPVQTSVTNFFHNARAPITIVNEGLQGKFYPANVALGRFMINSTAGVAGVFDVATRMDIADPEEDFGQTLGYWGLGQGPFLMLPFLGPSTGRDLSGSIVDQFLYPISYISNIDDDDNLYLFLEYGLRGLELINLRASLLGFEDTLDQQFDPYVFLRSYYLENRLQAVYDGDVPPEVRRRDEDPDEGQGQDNNP